MSTEICKNFYQKTYLNEFRLGIFGNKKVLENLKLGGDRDSGAQAPF